ncbi:hypothetical protein MBLNU13_g09123t1 [Cladosporium sp. NU13]
MPKTPGSNDLDVHRIRSSLALDATISLGHAYFVSTAPHLRNEESPQDYLDRLVEMSSALETWDILVADVVVDVERRTAVVRADFYLKVKFDPEIVRNEILCWCQMDWSGRKVVRSTAFIDPIAGQALGIKLKAVKNDPERD